jgi:hypothetical protein
VEGILIARVGVLALGNELVELALFTGFCEG